MAEIGQRIFAVDGTRKFLRLYNEEYLRPLTVGTSRTWVRIGMLFQVPDTGGNSPAGNYFIGLCNGADSPYTDANCRHAMGIAWAGGVFFYGAGPSYNNSGSAWRGRHRINGVNSDDTSGSLSTTFYAGPTRRNMWFVDVNPGTVYWHACSDPTIDHTFYNFLEILEQKGSTPTFNNGGNAMYNYQKTPAGSSALPLDTLNIYWGNGNWPIEILALAAFAFDS